MSPHEPDSERRTVPVEYEPRLVEEAVRLAIERPRTGVSYIRRRRLERRHRLELDRIYALPSGVEREAGFRRRFLETFRRLGLDEAVSSCLGEHPQTLSGLECVIVRAASGRAQEGVQLWEDRDRRGAGIPAYLVLTLIPERFVDPSRLRGLLDARLRAAAPPLAGRVEQDASPAPSDAGTKRCPLCEFPTGVWAAADRLRGLAASIRSDFPDWSPEDGACEHCADRYAFAPSQAGPPAGIGEGSRA